MGKKSRKKDKIHVPPRAPCAGVKEALEAPPPSEPTLKAATPLQTTRKRMNRIGCQESFKWTSNEMTPLELPPMNQQRSDRLAFTKMLQQTARQGWKRYFKWRLTNNESLIQEASRCASLKDGLSGPVSLASLYVSYTIERLYSSGPACNAEEYALEAASQELFSGDPLHVVLVGATAVNEEKILKETKYWEELGRLLPGRRVHLYLTGVEMSGNYKLSRIIEEELGMTVECWKGKAADFFSQAGRLELFWDEETVIGALNCGLGMAAANITKARLYPPSNGVIWDWLPSFLLMAAMDLPVFFTACIYEGAEKCLKVLQHVVGAYAISSIKIGTTSFETTVETRPGEGDALKVLKANSFTFGVKGMQAGHTTFEFSDVFDEWDNDQRPEYLLSILSEAPSATIFHPSLFDGVRDPRRLAPLRKYGDYISGTNVDGGGIDGGVVEEHEEAFLGESRAGNGLGMEEGGAKSVTDVGPDNIKRVHLKHTVDVREEASVVVVNVEGVFIANPSLARVGVQNKSLALYYEDCQDFREALFESALPLEVDHKTAEVIFHPSEARVAITIHLLKGK